MKRTHQLVLVTILLIGFSSCAPSTKFFPIRPFPRQAKPENAVIQSVPDPPGKPYQLMGVILANGQQTEFIGNTQSSVAEAVYVKARSIGADAILKGKIASSSSYNATSSGIYENQHHRAMAYAISWALPSDSTYIPGDTTVQSIMDIAEEATAQKQGMLSKSVIQRMKVGLTKKSEADFLLGEPLSQSVVDNTYMFIETRTYRITVLDFFDGSKRVILSLGFDRNGILSSKMVF